MYDNSISNITEEHTPHKHEINSTTANANIYFAMLNSYQRYPLRWERKMMATCRSLTLRTILKACGNCSCSINFMMLSLYIWSLWFLMIFLLATLRLSNSIANRVQVLLTYMWTLKNITNRSILRDMSLKPFLYASCLGLKLSNETAPKNISTKHYSCTTNLSDLILISLLGRIQAQLYIWTR